MSEYALSGSAAETANVGARAVPSSRMGGKMTAMALLNFVAACSDKVHSFVKQPLGGQTS